MKIFLKDSDDRYLRLDDMDLVFTYNKDEAFNFEDVKTEEFADLKTQIESAYNIELETIFE